MRFSEIGWWFWGFMVLNALPVAVGLGQDSSAPPGDLLKFLVEKNERGWQTIQSLTSIQYTVEREWLDRRSRRPFRSVGRLKQRGKCLWSTYRFQARTGPLRVVREVQGVGGPLQMLEPDTSLGQTKIRATSSFFDLSVHAS